LAIAFAFICLSIRLRVFAIFMVPDNSHWHFLPHYPAHRIAAEVHCSFWKYIVIRIGPGGGSKDPEREIEQFKIKFRSFFRRMEPDQK
jgi:hypothetical protein